MSQFQESAAIIKVEQLGADVYRLTVEAPLIAAAAKPGQFVMVRTGKGYDPLLRRPLSIHLAARDGLLQILFKVVGKGTALLAAHRQGQCLEIFGPLGRGFSVPDSGGKILLVGGGMGIAPLYYAAREYLHNHDKGQFHILLGARNAEELGPLARDFTALSQALELATDDGSSGHHGYVVDLLTKKEGIESNCHILACGPYPMLKAVARTCRLHGWGCQVSLETMMACGMGACLGCAIPPANLSGSYLHVCSDGPVFNAEEIAWL